MLAREFGDDMPGMVEHLSFPPMAIEEGLRYIRAYAAEIAVIEAAGDRLAATLPLEQVAAVS